MVCPLCARLHGAAHADGCPGAVDWSRRTYLDGWVSARDALVPPLCDEIASLRERASGVAKEPRTWTICLDCCRMVGVWVDAEGADDDDCGCDPGSAGDAWVTVTEGYHRASGVAGAPTEEPGAQSADADVRGGESEWVRCTRCGHEWNDLDPFSEVCSCLDTYGERLVVVLEKNAATNLTARSERSEDAPPKDELEALVAVLVGERDEARRGVANLEAKYEEAWRVANIRREQRDEAVAARERAEQARDEALSALKEEQSYGFKSAGEAKIADLEARLRRAVEERNRVIDQSVDHWHGCANDITLNEWLGLTWDEYERWVEASDELLADLPAASEALSEPGSSAAVPSQTASVGERQGWQPGSLSAPAASEEDPSVVSEPERAASRGAAVEWQWREGMVTVYDHEGRYLGCIGIATWQELLAARALPVGEAPPDEERERDDLRQLIDEADFYPAGAADAELAVLRAERRLADVTAALREIADRHPYSERGEHPAVDIARDALAALEPVPAARAGQGCSSDASDDPEPHADPVRPASERAPSVEVGVRQAPAPGEPVPAAPEKEGESHAEFLAAERALSDELEQYIGKWVAVRDHRVVASEDTLAALLARARVTVDGMFYVSESSAFFSHAAVPAAPAVAPDDETEGGRA